MVSASPKMKVGEIARIRPETMRVFARYKIDLCCGGAHSLEFVAQKHGLNLEALLEEINKLLEAGSSVRQP